MSVIPEPTLFLRVTYRSYLTELLLIPHTNQGEIEFRNMLGFETDENIS
jgi:hypothetical protein